MTNFSWWADQAEPGTFMCCICFEYKLLSEANPVEGEVEDVCLSCAEAEKKEMEKRRGIAHEL
jgi:hypothetical protein